jgi:hypothetical protein
MKKKIINIIMTGEQHTHTINKGKKWKKAKKLQKFIA